MLHDRCTADILSAINQQWRARPIFSDDCYTNQWVSPAMVYPEFDFLYRRRRSPVVIRRQPPARLLETASLWEELWEGVIIDGGDSADQLPKAWSLSSVAQTR
jgi:hypothetical protein